ncbi:TPA: AAA family ATPase [Candidatus Woesearchaeota archaeon]|nr:AAA family ATPase [Candidatus Woesearchaeota archaeon]HIG92618.1 AAA family ATPase [Candidatus Woesearchaeota archaeon]HIH12890.1 AAA family ATPase [Candidatus Woesearchaeota archaeon]
MIIGVTGSYASGKDTVAEILKKMNFYHFSFSDILREELQRRRDPVTRDNLIAIGNELREIYGPDILARLTLEKIKDGENYVFTSIRNPAEVHRLKEQGNFLLIKVVAPAAVRLERLKKRNREEDPKTMKDLLQKEGLENTANPNAQQLDTVAKLARVTITNDGSLEKLQGKVEQLVKDWLFKLQSSRPDWDHYFMNIAEQVKMRCNCLSAKKGAVLVRDKIILSTGYNGTPKGITHCTEGGCVRCTSRHLGKLKSGDYSEPCICCHAEENAIVQAAYNGASTKGSALYTTFTPCTTCAKMIINAGVTEVIAKVMYPDDVGTKLLKEAGVGLRVLG